jgi:uncharacterized membrane protein
MYKIIGADQKEYGPISAEQIRQWIAEGRVNGQTSACAEGSQEWKPLEMFPEFAFTASNFAPPAPETPSEAPVSPEEILARDYTLDLGNCISRAWQLFKDNFATLFVTFLLLVVLAIAVGGAVQLVFAAIGANHLSFTAKQYLNPIYLIFNGIVLGPAMGGVYHVYLSVIRGKPANAGDLFIGFKSFQDLFLGKLIPSLIITVCMIPYSIASTAKMAPFFDRLQQNPSAVNPHELVSQMLSGFTSSAPIFLICVIPTMYLSVNWQFVLPLIIDKKMGFWTAMKTSWKMVHKHWLHIFGLLVLVGLINIVGLCACCVGLLVTIPIGLTAFMYAYEDIFGRKTT